MPPEDLQGFRARLLPSSSDLISVPEAKVGAKSADVGSAARAFDMSAEINKLRADLQQKQATAEAQNPTGDLLAGRLEEKPPAHDQPPPGVELVLSSAQKPK